jgi:hypothetical protein
MTRKQKEKKNQKKKQTRKGGARIPKKTLQKNSLRKSLKVPLSKTLAMQKKPARNPLLNELDELDELDDFDTEYHPEFQPLIDALGEENVLDSIAHDMLGREGIKVISPDGNLSALERRLGSHVPSDFSGVVYKSGHWLGYEPEVVPPRTVYNSYKTNLQQPGTSNFCQSFATFLWARRGDFSFEDSEVNITFVPGEYARNVQKMATLLLAWIRRMSSDSESKAWLRNTFKSDEYNAKLEDLVHTLQRLAADVDYAKEFSEAEE